MKNIPESTSTAAATASKAMKARNNRLLLSMLVYVAPVMLLLISSYEATGLRYSPARSQQRCEPGLESLALPQVGRGDPPYTPANIISGKMIFFMKQMHLQLNGISEYQ